MCAHFHAEEETRALEQQLSEADMVRFTFADLHGIARTKLVPKQLVAHTIRRGTPLPDAVLAFGPRSELPAVKSFAKRGFSNAVLACCPGTVSRVQWSKSAAKHHIAQVLCEVHWPDYTVQEACPRYLARRQVARLKDRGWHINTGYECEFTVVDNETLKPVFGGNDYLVQSVTCRYEDLFLEINRFLSAAGIQGECYEVEYGSGQFEIPLVPAVGVRAADDVFVLKHAIKEYCDTLGLLATFMSKPAEDNGGMGTHLNHSIWDDSGNNVFYDANGKYKLSQVAWHWLGGLVAHLPALTALCNPTVNCYYRVGVEFFAPKLVNWAVDNRLTSIRVKNSSPAATYLENRIPSGACNPYISLAATIAAGLDGVKNKIEPPAKQADETAEALPTKLSMALDALENDTALCEALGMEFIEWFVTSKREIEVKKLENETSTFEMQQEEYIRLM